MYGYAGNILRVDLTSRKVSKEPLPQWLVDEYVGGRGFVARIILDEVPPGTDPLGPGNKLVMAAGPLTGLPLPGTGRTHFAILSPATGGYGDSNMGGHFGPELKYAGYDVLIVEGRAEKPSYLFIDDGRVEIRAAEELWGLGAFRTEERLKAEVGEEFKVAVIGPAGENLVKFAAIAHDYGRQAGRTGVGAVMGSKNLKAIAVRGTGAVPLAQPRKLLEISHRVYRDISQRPGSAAWTEYGTAGIVPWANGQGVMPTRNFQGGWFDRADQIDGKALREKIFVNHKGCMGCPIPCGKYSRVTLNGNYHYVEGPEYETLSLVGTNCAVDSIEGVAYLNWLLDDLGLDSISGGSLMAFTAECFERGILDEERLGGPVHFGDVNSLGRIAQMIAYRQGIGDLLAEGVRTAARSIGPAAEKLAIQIKGLEVSGYEPRSTPAMLLAYMTCDIGAHHNRSWAVTWDFALGRMEVKGKADKVIDQQHVRPTFDTLGVCRLHWVEVGFELENYPEMLEAVTGRARTWDELKLVGERVWNTTRAIFLLHVPGFGRKDDMPPERFYTEKLPDGPGKGMGVTLDQVEALLDDYYAQRGWDRNGVPTAGKLEQVGLAPLAGRLRGVGVRVADA